MLSIDSQSHCITERALLRVRLSAAVLVKLRGELRRLARSDSPEIIRFVDRMHCRYPELKEGALLADGGDA